jgi:hypothetical protein
MLLMKWKRLVGSVGVMAPVLAFGQEEWDGPGEVAGPAADTSGGAGADGFQPFLQTYTSWDLFKVGWFLATVMFAYGIGTMFFLMLLRKRHPTLAGRYGLFWFAIAFLLVHVFLFGMLLQIDLPGWAGWAVASVLLVLVVLLLLGSRKRAVA